MYQLRHTIALVGLMGAGKTAVGTGLAAELGVPFVDSDHEIEKAADRSVAEIFAEHGEPFFREKETQVLQRLMEGPPTILSTGGGAFMREENRRVIQARGVALWLKADLELLWSRVRGRDKRPLLMTEDPYGVLRDLYEARTPIYAKAELCVEGEAGLSLPDMTQKVVRYLLDAPASGVSKRES